jgi:hypothetical protein
VTSSKFFSLNFASNSWYLCILQNHPPTPLPHPQPWSFASETEFFFTIIIYFLFLLKIFNIHLSFSIFIYLYIVRAQAPECLSVFTTPYYRITMINLFDTKRVFNGLLFGVLFVFYFKNNVYWAQEECNYPFFTCSFPFHYAVSWEPLLPFFTAIGPSVWSLNRTQ